jgi:hypothetical protein
MMRKDVMEETIRAEIKDQAERFGVDFASLSPKVQEWLRSLVIFQMYEKDAAPIESPEAEAE